MKKTALALAFAVGATSIPVSGIVQAAEKPTYDDVFLIDGIKSYKANGGQYQQSYISYAFDGNTTSHWETGKANNNNFDNHVIVQFDKVEEIGSISYFPRVHGHANKGFPTHFTIYGATSDDVFGKDVVWTPIHEEKVNIASGEMKIKLDEVAKVNGIKFVFEEAHQGYAAASEFKFYNPDPETDEVSALFTDGTMSQVVSGVDKAKLDALLAKVSDHPSTHLVDTVKLAQSILVDNTVKDTVFEVEQRGNGESHARGTLRTSSYGSNFIPTGIAAMAGEEIKVYVDVEEGKPLPQIVFTQQVGRWNKWKSIQSLKQGENIFTVPNIHDPNWGHKVEAGGAIYLLYPYDKETGGNPKVRIDGGHEYPLFNDKDDPVKFIEELKAYKAEWEKDKTKRVDIVELVSDYAIVNSNMASASVMLREENPKSPQEIVNFHNLRLKQYFALAGITDNDKDIKHNRNGARANLRLMQPWAFAYASGDHTGFQQGSMNVIFSGNNFGWAISHELGHHFDIMGGKLPEITNNVWANYNAVVLNGEGDRISSSAYENTFKKAGAYNHAELDREGTNSLAVWWQLQLFDENYWPNYNRAIRDGIIDKYKLNNNQNMVVASSYALNMDLTEYFVRHKFITQEVADSLKPIIEELQIPAMDKDIKPWYMWTKAAKNKKQFEGSYTPEIVSVKENNGKIELKLDIDSSAHEALLGYEVLQDGNVIGFTSTNTFTTLQEDDAKPHVYKVRAYDMKQNTTGYSKEVTFDSSAPVIKVVDSTIIPVGTPVDISEKVEAESDQGTDANLTHTGKVSSDNLGFYTLKYTATDSEGKKSTKDVRYHTATEVIYASEMQESYQKTGYKQLMKNTGMYGDKISLLLNGEEKEYDKGLGAHANSRVEYELNAKYDLFEAFIGIDGHVRNNPNPSVTFQVFVDDVLKFESGLVTAATEQEHVKLDITGAKKIALVTNARGSATADHSVWADAKFARIYPEKTETQILGELKEALGVALNGVDVSKINMLRFGQPHIAYNNTNEVENQVIEKLKALLDGKYFGTFSIVVTNTGGANKTADDLIKNGSYISYKELGGKDTYIMSGDKVSKANLK